jgi:hypothetical protein
MVNIDPDKPILNICDPNREKSLTNGKKSEFDAIFRQAVDSKEFKAAATESAEIISEIRPVKFSDESLPSANLIVDRVQRLIDTMGIYQQKLADRGATLKDIQTLVQQMSSQSESLNDTSNTAEGQEGLKTIVNQSLTLASMEIAKFNSGYYNDG